MFGVFALLTQIGAIIYGDYRNKEIKRESKKRALDNGNYSYIDRFGKEYDVNTDRKVYVAYDNHNTVLKDCKTGVVVRDIAAEQNKKRFSENKEKAIRDGKRFFLDPSKKMYCEVSTGKYYKRYTNINRDFWTWYTDVENTNRHVYEYGEGPSDNEIDYRNELYNAYLKIKNKHDAYGSLSEWDYRNNMDEYWRKVNEKNLLFIKMENARMKIKQYDKKMVEKYKRGKKG